MRTHLLTLGLGAALICAVSAGALAKGGKPPAKTDAKAGKTDTKTEKEDDSMSFGAVDVEVKSVEREVYEGAVQKTKADQCDKAIFEFYDVLQNPKAQEFHEGSEYYIAKCLYRLGLYHAALNKFAVILEKGEKSPYFQTSREWLFFISRKLKDQGAVLDVIAKYSTAGGVPEKYADEFHYLLGKYYFMMALGDLAPNPDEGRASEAEQRGKDDEDKTGIDFGKDKGGDEGGETKGDDKGKEEKKKEEGGGLDFGGGGGDLGLPSALPYLRAAPPGDDFDFSLDDVDKKGKKGKKGKKDKKDKKDKKATDKTGDKPVETGTEGGTETGSTETGTPESTAPEKAKDEKAYRSKEALPPGEALERSLQHLEQVPEGAKYFAKARFMQGLIYFQRDDFEKAVESFRLVVRLTHPKTGAYKSPRLRQLAFFSLARTHYGFKQFRYALFYYDKISRDSEAWLEALFESSWAYFRLGNYEKSLGNLITLHSPFFVDEYFPESLVLEAITYYENCRYPEARGILDEFEKHYGGVRDELTKITKEGKKPEEYYKLLEEFEAKEQNETNRLTLRLVRLALSDRGLHDLDVAVNEIDDEMKRMGQVVVGMTASPLGQQLEQALQKRRADVVGRAGTIMRDKLIAERDDLKALSNQLLRIQFEITKMEKMQIEADMRGESLVVPLAEYGFSTAVDDEHEYYPFVGEYWRDELGTYEYTMVKGCRPESSE